jgi:hypothetical protein
MTDRNAQRTFQIVVVCAATLGIALRLRLYLENRSLWLDPAMLALNIIDKDPSQLLGRLDMNQAAPAGFLLVSKVVGSLFDYSEFALRLFPCLLGITALVLFIRLAVEVLGYRQAPLAYIPMATASTAIFYCAEFRPQSADLFFTVLVLCVSHTVLVREWSAGSIMVFAVVGIVAVWFSYAAVFVIAGTGAALTLLALRSSSAESKGLMAAVFALVMIHFVVLYLVQIRTSIGTDLYSANTAAYAPVVAASGGQRWWWILAIKGYFQYPLGFRGFYAIPFAGLLVGIGGWLVGARRRPFATVAGAPVLLLLVASGLNLYPIATGIHEVKSRFVLFTIPIALLFIGFGTARLCELLATRKCLSYAIVALLLIPSLYGGISGPRFPGQEMRPLVDDLVQALQSGDTVYVFHASLPAFRYYTRHQPVDAVFGINPHGSETALVQELERLRRADRLWVVASHTYGGERRLMRRKLRAMGVLREVHRYPGAVLFECRRDP